MIPPAAQRFLAQRASAPIEEVAGSYAIYISQRDAVAALSGVRAAADAPTEAFNADPNGEAHEVPVRR